MVITILTSAFFLSFYLGRVFAKLSLWGYPLLYYIVFSVFVCKVFFMFNFGAPRFESFEFTTMHVIQLVVHSSFWGLFVALCMTRHNQKGNDEKE